MSKKPSAATELRRLRRDYNGAAEHVRSLQRELMEARGQRTKAQQEAAEWKARFDALLARVPLKVIEP